MTFAKTFGFRTIVVDARSAFATRKWFPHADAMIVERPFAAMSRLGLDEAAYVVVLTCNDKWLKWWRFEGPEHRIHQSVEYP